MSPFGWCQVAFDVVAFLWIGLHRHPIHWRRR